MRYHRNAVTNQNQRSFIQNSNAAIAVLAEQFRTSLQTVVKWKHADRTTDKSSRPDKIHYAFTDEEQGLIVFCRKSGLVLDEIWQGLQIYLPWIKRINTYRVLARKGLNCLPQEEKETKHFKKYLPGYLHLDWFYLPRLEEKKRYCIIAIDRATKWLIVGFYSNMTKGNACDFLKRLKKELPFKIKIILTDNGFSFSNRRYRRNGKAQKEHDFTRLCRQLKVNQRLTKVKHPWTNGLAENAIKQIKANTTKKFTLNGYQEAELCITTYVYYHNFIRRHQSLNFQTSYQTLQQYRKTHPKLFIKEPADMLKLFNNVMKLTS